MKKLCAISFMILSIFFAASFSGATPLRLEYSVEDLGTGLFQYEFSLILDNNDGSWFSGQGFNWIIFGDNLHPYSNSPLTNFVGNSTDLPVGPGPTDADAVAEEIPGTLAEGENAALDDWRRDRG